MSNLLNFGAAILTNHSAFVDIIGRQENIQSTEAQISRIANEVNMNMTTRETSSKLTNVPSVLNLYFHFFLSIFAFAECSVRISFHLLALFTIFFSYYVVLCIFCGKAKADLNLLSDYHSKMYGLYCSLFCGILSNLVVPWNPPLFAFRIKGSYLNRPVINGQQLHGPDLNTIIRNAICSCCCCASPIADIPAYKILQASLFSYGGLQACNSFSLCCLCFHNNNNNTMLSMYLHQLRLQVELDNAEDTREFYNQEYGCSSFEEVVSTRIETGTTTTTASPVVHTTATVTNTSGMRPGVPVSYIVPTATQHQIPPRQQQQQQQLHQQQQQSSIPIVFASAIPLSKSN